MRKAIQNRISVRSYSKLELSENEIDKINDLIKNINSISDLNLELLKDGSSAFKNFKTSYGMFSNVKSMILMKGNKQDKFLKEKIGYYGEAMIFDLTDMDIGTCWVGGTFDRTAISLKEDEELVCVILVGHQTSSIKDELIRKAMHMKRKTIKERIVADKDLPNWIKDGLESLILAPSAKNTQKAILKYEKDNLRISIDENYYFDLVDLGIAKKHFEEVVNGKFELGNDALFHKNLD